MEFVDYKCLESLLIEGEELIATEGFVSNIMKRIIDFFKLIGRMIDRLIDIIKAKFNKSSGKNLFNEAKAILSKKNGTTIITSMVRSISGMISIISMTCASIRVATMPKNEIESLDERVNNCIEDIDEEIEDFYSNYNKINGHLDEYYVSGGTKVRDYLLRELEEMKTRVDKLINEIDKDVKENKFEGGKTLSGSIYSSLTKSMGKVTPIINNTIDIINKIEFR